MNGGIRSILSSNSPAKPLAKKTAQKPLGVALPLGDDYDEKRGLPKSSIWLSSGRVYGVPLDGCEAMEAKLVIVSGKTNKRDVKLKLPTVIGRSREADLTIAHPMISRRHCQLWEADGFIKIKDLGSLNGTYVYGKRIDQEVLLRPNDEFTIGPLTFRVEYEAPAGAIEPPPQVPEETPEYIPPLPMPPSEPAPAALETPELAETPPEEPALTEAAVSPPHAGASPWEDLDALEKEFDFDLQEDLTAEKHPQPPEVAADLEDLAEASLLEEPEMAVPKTPESKSPPEVVQPEPPPESEETLAEETPPEPSAPGEEEAAGGKQSPDSAAPPTPMEEDQSLGDDLDEIEDAALRDFLKGLH